METAPTRARLQSAPTMARHGDLALQYGLGWVLNRGMRGLVSESLKARNTRNTLLRGLRECCMFFERAVRGGVFSAYSACSVSSVILTAGAEDIAVGKVLQPRRGTETSRYNGREIAGGSAPTSDALNGSALLHPKPLATSE